MKIIWAPWRMKFIVGAHEVKDCIFCTFPKEKKDEANLILKRGKNAFVIVNKFPYNSGHLMIVPYEHTKELSKLDDGTLLEMHQLIRDSMNVLQTSMNPQGFNVGMNVGEAGGAGIKDHLHYHVVPRWNGDTNFMPAIGETKVLPETLEDTYTRLKRSFFAT